MKKTDWDNAHMVHIRMSDWMYSEVDRLRKKIGISISDIIRMGILKVIKENPEER